MSDLDLIAQIDEKIHQLPVEILPQVNDYIHFLLQKYRHSPTDTDREAAKQFLKQLRSSCYIGDVISPIDESWDATS